jgi:hypothetical protein
MMRPLTACTMIPITGVLAACWTDPPGPDFEQRLTYQSACADVIFFAVDESDRLMLTFRANGLVEEARNLGEEIVRTFDFPVAAADLVVEQGSRVSDATCDDVIENGGPQVDRTWGAVEGRALVTIRPGLTDFSARGDLLLEDVVVEDGDGSRAVIERMEWANLSVGWFPG